MLELFRMQKCFMRFQQLDDGFISLEDLQAIVFRESIVNAACGVNIAGWVKFVENSGYKVLSAMRRRGKDHARSCIHGDVIREHAEYLAVLPGEERMIEICLFHRAAGEICDRWCAGESTLFCDR